MVVRCPGEIKFDSLSFPAAAAARHNFHQRKFAYCWFCQTLGRNLEAAISREMIKKKERSVLINTSSREIIFFSFLRLIYISCG